MPNLTPRRPNLTGAAVPAVAVTSETVYSVPNSGRVVLHIYTDSEGEPSTVTVAGRGTVGGQPIEDLVADVATNTTTVLGPFSPAAFNDVHGYMQVTITPGEGGGLSLLALEV